MRDAFGPFDPRGSCLIVLTLDRFGTYSGEQPWRTAHDAYRALSRMTGEFLKRLRKWMRIRGWTPLGNQWVATVEAHRSGWPHMNIVLWAPELADWISAEKNERLADGMSERDSSLVSRDLADIVTSSGFGLVSTAERARSPDEALGYIVKVAGKFDESLGELAKMTQLPVNAPFRFRRIRSGKGFLPRRRKAEGVTGTLLRRFVFEGFVAVEPLHRVKDPSLIDVAVQVCGVEEEIWQREQATAARCARQVRAFGPSAAWIPPVTRWVGSARVEQILSRKAENDLCFECSEMLRQSSL